MTLVISLIGRKSIWLCADRRITFPKSYRDDACKIVYIAATNAEGLLGYSGLGMSRNGVEPSSWISDLLRGQPIAPLEQYLGLITDAMRKVHPHMEGFEGSKEHMMLIPSIVDREPRLYAIGTGVGPDHVRRYRYERYAQPNKGAKPPRVAITGSGAFPLIQKGKWWKPLLQLVGAYERGKISALVVCDHLADLNFQTSHRDKTVSPNSIVVWRSNGGGHQFYSGIERVKQDKPIPTVANGIDVNEIVSAMAPATMPHLRALLRGENPELDLTGIQERLNDLARRKARDL